MSDAARLEAAVILEDPRLPYRGRTGSHFSPVDELHAERLREALAAVADYRLTLFDRHDTLVSDLAAARPAIAFNLCEAGLHNEAELEPLIPALLELLEIPCSGAGPRGLLLSRDKALVSSLASGWGIPVPEETLLDVDVEQRLAEFSYPALLKPNLEEGSFALTADSVVDSPAAAAAGVESLRARFPGLSLLLQEYLTGPEYSVGLVGNPETGFLVLPVNEIDYSQLEGHLPPILTEEFKDDHDSPYHRQVRYREASLEPGDRRRLLDSSRLLFERLCCRDYARFDYRADAGGTVKLLEVNANPAWAWKGSLHHMAQHAGYSYVEFVQLLFEAALVRTGVGDVEPRLWRPEAGR